QFLLRVRQESVCRSMQITFHRLPQSRRAEQLDTLCTLLLREARQRSRIQRDGEMDAVRLRECVTSTLLLASSEDEHGIAQRYAREFDPLFSEWPEIGLYYAAANSALKDAQRLEITSISLTPDSRDPALTFLAGWFCEKGGNASLARRYYERTIALAPSEYPAAYLRLSGILHSAFRDSARAAEILRRGIRACTLAPEREEMQQRLREYEAAEP
ncbi:MAG: hypothetical protein JXA28_05270, partial [Bacteroidetes bacterium]|nr:hypothetical protein [Bacteroidota bacterium]